MTNKIFNPKVSIVIPVYNGANYLAQAIDSAMAQTYRNIEILVVNDGSNDAGETERIALSYGARIRYFKKPNGGVASALNLAIEKMSGEFFSWLSHDDLYVTEKIEKQVELLSSMLPADAARSVVYSDYYTFSTDPRKTIPILMQGVPPEEFRYWITVVNLLHGCTLLIPKAAFAEVGRFNEQLRTTQDYDLWFRMAGSYRFVHLPEPLVKSRTHSEQGSIKMADIAFAECSTLLSGFVDALTKEEIFRASPHSPAVAYARIAASMWCRGYISVGWRAIRLSFDSFPQSSRRANMSAIKIIMESVLLYSMVNPIRRFTPPSILPIVRRFNPNRIRFAIKNALGPNPEMAPSIDSLRNMDLKEKFSEVYAKNIFRGKVSRSGEGSDLAQTAVIRREIPTLLWELDIKSFLDAPCGDWYWMKEIDLPVERYIGLDIVDAIVERNQRAFGDAKVSFQCMDLANGDLPKADLIFSRDCLVHLSFVDALKIIANFKRSGAKYLLTTTFTDRKNNDDLGDGFWRPLNQQLAPFNFPEPIRLINEGCTEGNNLFTDKCLGLWLLEDINP